MKQKDFNVLRRKVYLAYHQDGILDLMAGAIVLGFGTFMLTHNIAFLIFGWLVASLYVLLKKLITIPRFGYVRFDSEKKALVRGLAAVGIGVLVMFLVLAANIFLSNRPTSPEMQAWTQRYHMVPLSATLFGLPALAAAMFLGLKRFYIYVLLAVGLPALGAWLDIQTFVPIITIGLIVLAFGAGLLVNFLKNHPVNDDGNSSNVSG